MNRLLVFLLLSGWGAVLPGNNISVANVILLAEDVAAGTRRVSVDLGWDNSWKTSTAPHNWDAAWVFLKYRVDEGDWHHASLVAVADVPTECTADVPPDGRGVFISRATAGAGSVQYDGLQLVWDYALDGVAAGSNVSVQVFAVETVYVPENDFYLGSGSKTTNEFYQYKTLLPDYAAFLVEGEGALSLTGANGLTVPLTELLANIPAAFPKGHRSFYCMKYETSQRQFVSFYNALSATQREGLNLQNFDLRVLGSPVARNGIVVKEDGSLVTSAPDVPVGSLSLNQMLAYLEWSGLRPMTEMEFEKACRGPRVPVAREYAWGTSSVRTALYAVAEVYTEAEWVTNMDGSTASRGNGLYQANSPLGGPLRCGIFAASTGTATRAWSGGSYYGIMELSGNLSEAVVTVTDPTGRAFTAVHGDGDLAPDGGTDTNWPLLITAYGTRGGSYALTAPAMEVSYRSPVPETTLLSESIGFRGIRSAPSE